MMIPTNEFSGEIPIKLELKEDYQTQLPDGSSSKTLKASLPSWFIERLNLVIRNQNTIIKSPLFKSIMGLDKTTKNEQDK